MKRFETRSMPGSRKVKNKKVQRKAGFFRS